ncbi:hypothetical protein SLEP1_g12690 [Rubroshorea leprosula]|uniref:ABC transmembrane type-1 domain-containing protein n=1 Tax=Rubroshorea leprosula TaxID=152421 RepID=A0AAV5ILA9_9ROSI|nr:hypothetical protein SLEP1_g12690 [Rubroshorea leprosula]
MRTELVDEAEYEELPGGEQICPERHATIFSRIFFSWMSPLMQQGYRRPITEKDIWKLDTWDRTETLNEKFQECWAKEMRRPKPWLLRALNSSLGGRFWWGGFWKIGNDLSQFVGPLVLNHLLQSMQQGDPSWIGYIYAFSIFAGVAVGVLFEAQYFQNVMRVGFRLRATLTLVISKMQKLSKEGLQRTDRRIGLMNEILAAMDTVKCYCWESSFQSKVQSVRNDELSWFRKASLLGAVQKCIRWFLGGDGAFCMLCLNRSSTSFK